MYYSAIGLVALLVLLIENQDILLKRNNEAFDKPSWTTYRHFLYVVVIYYVSDILWGIIEQQKMPRLLFIDTSLYFMAMAVGVWFWTEYVILYLEEENGFGRFFTATGKIMACLVLFFTIVNVFVPVFFTVDENCVYHALAVRFGVLIAQILLLVTISVYALVSIMRKQTTEGKKKRCRTIAMFGLIMVFFMFMQIWFAYLPMYAIAYMLGTCLLRSFVIGTEKEEYRTSLQEAQRVSELQQSISSLLDNMPSLSFYKDAETGVYLACNQSFAEYAHKEKPEQVVGLTDAQIFDQGTASHFVEDDRMALSMDEPYVFFEDVPDAIGNRRQFQTTKLKFYDANGRLCLLGMCQDVTDMVRVQRENDMTKEAYEEAKKQSVIFTHIAQTLADSYVDLYYINLETGMFIDYQKDEASGSLKEVSRGEDFFAPHIISEELKVDPLDQELVEKSLNKETLTDNISRNKTFMVIYRRQTAEGPVFVSMKATEMKDDKRFIILGVTNVNEEMRERQAAERIREEHIAYARLNALAGDFISVHVVVPETGRYREFSTSEEFLAFDLPKEGTEFFEKTREYSRDIVCPEDLDRFLARFTKEEVLSEVKNKGFFAMTYRLMISGRPNYIQLKASMVKEKEGDRLIVGIHDIDAMVRQERAYEQRLAQAQSMANIDALTGIRNKHAYQNEEERLDREIEDTPNAEFAIVILDVNDLKTVNDTRGHQAGDQYLKDACKIICDTFRHSPVFRVGGDEFAVIAQGEDYEHIEDLMEKVAQHNKEAIQSGGVVIACGMARYEKAENAATVFMRADKKMYENKSTLKENQKKLHGE